MNLTIQIFQNAQWQDAALLEVPEPAEGRQGLALLSYHPQSYAIEHFEEDDVSACSMNLPVSLMDIYRSRPWFTFLDDIMPAGASRRYWVNALGIGHLTGRQQDFQLLAKGTIAPVGNLRIKESVPEKISGSQLASMCFQMEDVVERHTDFLEYAQAMGAASGGATGAGGEAPKLLLRCSPENQIWIDTWQDDLTNTDQHYLVKFPRGKRSVDDCDILRAEFHYYHELAAMGVDTINTDAMRLLEGSRYPSLWLPRFDITFVNGQLQRYGLESIYSLLGKEPGSYLNHFSALQETAKKLLDQHRVANLGEEFDVAAFVVEWVRRDFLNVVFGNSDNHGRNTSLIKRPDGITLSPVYDFAPMKADPEGIVRSTTWGAPYEEGGQFDWIAIANALSAWVAPALLIQELRELAKKIQGLPERLAARGVPERLLNMPTLGFSVLDKKLAAWHLLND